MRFFI